ncbi:MAG: PIN/TRAM domain-containing protein [Phototrophicaceae bacterium]
MSGEFLSRIFGMFFFMIVGAQIGVSNANLFSFPPDIVGFIFALVGILVGLIITPYLTIRPVEFVRRTLNGVSVEVFLISAVGLVVGLVLALLVAYPLSLLNDPIGSVAPGILTLVFGYLGLSIFGYRTREILDYVLNRNRPNTLLGGRELLLDTSVLIDGRIVDIAQTGFLGGRLVVPRFVLSELHQVADSADALRRNRGRRGLAKLNELQRDPTINLDIIDEDVPNIPQVDDKLIALAIERDAVVVTNDFNLNQVAEAQGVSVLNINALAKAVRSIYIPGETFAIHVIQEGREEGQGVGYLEDGTMVVIEGGMRHMDRTINVEVTKLIERDAGRMIFARPNTQTRY